jgi:prevent-host-death family protein
MKYSETIKPISFLKAHASEVIRDVAENRKTLVITHHGEAKAVLQDVRVYEATQASMALLKMLALSAREIKRGETRELDGAFKRLDERVAAYKKSQNGL